MKLIKIIKATSFLVAVTSVGTLFGCANYEINTKRGNIPGYYIRYEMQEADRAIESARQAGKDKTCPAEFKAAEDAKNKAYDVFRACHTEEGSALAKQATEKAMGLCPPHTSVKVPAKIVIPPTDNLLIAPQLLTKGELATLTWTSNNATKCDIQPGIGFVQTQGSLAITPSESTIYTLSCTGDGGSVRSTANIDVKEPALIAVPAKQAAAAPAKHCVQTVLNIRFDTNKAVIKPQYAAELKQFADFLKEFPNVKGTIEGHTDSDGSKTSNMKLSKRRADTVRNYIVKNFGIAPERISTKGFGPTKPAAGNKTKADKEKNRRIETNFICDNN